MPIDPRLIAALLTASLIAGCTSDDRTTATSTSTTLNATTTTTTTTAAPATSTNTTEATTTTSTAATAVSTTAVPATLAPTTAASVAPPTTVAPTQIALWPAPGIAFGSPEQAAADFLANLVQPGPVLGEFRAGDQRSGEIAVFAADESGTPIGMARSTLLLRRLGPSDGWFVIGAVSDAAIIMTPEAGSAVAAGPVTVTGEAQGFEANIGVQAFLVGDADPLLDTTSTLAGNFGVPLPFAVTLDLSGAAPGDTVVILVHGGAGLETDPGDFGAIAVIIAA